MLQPSITDACTVERQALKNRQTTEMLQTVVGDLRIVQVQVSELRQATEMLHLRRAAKWLGLLLFFVMATPSEMGSRADLAILIRLVGAALLFVTFMFSTRFVFTVSGLITTLALCTYFTFINLFAHNITNYVFVALVSITTGLIMASMAACNDRNSKILTSFLTAYLYVHLAGFTVGGVWYLTTGDILDLHRLIFPLSGEVLLLRLLPLRPQESVGEPLGEEREEQASVRRPPVSLTLEQLQDLRGVRQISRVVWRRRQVAPGEASVGETAPGRVGGGHRQGTRPGQRGVGQLVDQHSID